MQQTMFDFLQPSAGAFPNQPASEAPEEEESLCAFFGDEYTSIYTRAEALEDGDLVDVSRMAREAGMPLPTAITRAVYARLTPSEEEAAHGQDFPGRLWDLLNILMYSARRNPNTDTLPFYFLMQEMSKTKRMHQVQVHVIAKLHGGDEGEPVVTIGYPEDF